MSGARLRQLGRDYGPYALVALLYPVGLLVWGLHLGDSWSEFVRRLALASVWVPLKAAGGVLLAWPIRLAIMRFTGWKAGLAVAPQAILFPIFLWVQDVLLAWALHLLTPFGSDVSWTSALAYFGIFIGLWIAVPSAIAVGLIADKQYRCLVKERAGRRPADHLAQPPSSPPTRIG